MPKKKNLEKILLILFIFLIFALSLHNSYTYLDPDLGWHLKVGQNILEEKNVPNINSYNFPLAGTKWVDHEWFMNLLMFIIFINAGYLALSIFFSLIVAAIFWLALSTAKKFYGLSLSVSFFIIAPLSLLGFIAMAPHIGIRIQELSMLNLAILLLIILHYQKYKKYKILFALPPLFYFWSISHGGFLIGFAVMAGWLIIKSTEIIIRNIRPLAMLELDDNINRRHLMEFALFALISLAATFLTPYGLRLYEFLGGYGNTYYLTHILEWLPLHYLPIQYFKLAYIALLLAVFFLNSAAAYKKYHLGKADPAAKIDLWQYGLMIFFVLLSFQSRRHFPLLFIATLPYFAYLIFQLLEFNRLDPLTGIIKRKFLAGLLLLAALLSAVYLLVTINFRADPFRSFCGFYPCGAADYLREHPELWQSNILNEYNWGGYLIWEMPELKLFIDGRMPQYRYQGHSYMEEYHALYDEEKLADKLVEYKINLVLVSTKEIEFKLNWFEKYILGFNEDKLTPKEEYLIDYLEMSPGWQKIYSDENSAIYLKQHESV